MPKSSIRCPLKCVSDLNRRSARHGCPEGAVGSDFRDRVRAHLRSGRAAFLVDAHSYPARHGEWGAYDVVLIEDSPTRYVPDLARALTESGGLRVATFEGGDNDVHAEAREMGVRSVLVEWNESLLDGSGRLERSVRALAEWLIDNYL